MVLVNGKYQDCLCSEMFIMIPNNGTKSNDEMTWSDARVYYRHDYNYYM